ncbi:MAG TPA: DUF3152 domain-containing protein [Nakamurella sp.]|nr:DUF3152 domain-containing protein [Nakamurella sp.]
MRWRLIAIPFLVLATVVVVFQTVGSPSEPTSASVPSTPGSPRPTGPSVRPIPTTVTDISGNLVLTTPAQAVPDPAMSGAEGQIAAAITSGALPSGPEIVATGAGTWHTVPGTGQSHGTGSETRTYSVEVEDGLQSAEADQAFAAAVDTTLADPRSWIGGGQVSLHRVDTGDPSFRVSLTSQMTIRSPDLCGWDVPLEASCFNGWQGRVLINDARWVRGAISYGTDVQSYRAYAVNHEVGHALGFSHQPCQDNGAPAPVMMQQSWSTADNDLHLLDPDTIPADGKVCVANPYPFPGAAQASATSPSAAAG